MIDNLSDISRILPQLLFVLAFHHNQLEGTYVTRSFRKQSRGVQLVFAPCI